MKIQQFDKNFAVKQVEEPDLVWYDVREEPFSVHGVEFDADAGRFLRIPEREVRPFSDAIKYLNTNTAGGRVRFRTDSPYIAICAVSDPFDPMPHMPITGQAGFDLYFPIGGKESYFKTFVPPTSWTDGYSAGTVTFGIETDYTINFPLYHGVKELYVGLKKGAELKAAAPYRHTVPVVFYGSSITQGGCASRPGNSYQGFLSRRLSTDFINLGFSGNALGEPEMAEYIAGLETSVFVMDYDSNAPTVGHLQKTHYPFYKMIRERRPDLPIILVTHCDAPYGDLIKNSGPEGWGTFEERYNVIRETYDRAKKDGDGNVYFIDGKELFAGEDWSDCTVDSCHPNDLGFYRFALRIEKTLEPLIGSE